jgi:hypothetical protein
MACAAYQQFDSGPSRRPEFERDHCWLDWYETSGSHTFGNAGAIRDKWNALTNTERRSIAPRAWQRIGEGISGRDEVDHALNVARRERNSP